MATDYSLIKISLFGLIYLVEPLVIDLGRKVYTVHQDDVLPHLPGFIPGAPHAICNIPKLLAKLGSSWRILNSVKIGENKWRYTFSYQYSDWTIEMVVKT